MPVAGNTFTVQIKDAHLNWGTLRYKSTRDRIYGEGYIQIPIQYARAFDIYNNNHPTATTSYNCSSVDGFLTNVPLLASGSSSSGEVHAKQFQGHGSLKTIGSWYAHLGATTQNQVRVTFTSPTDLIIELI